MLGQFVCTVIAGYIDEMCDQSPDLFIIYCFHADSDMSVLA